VLPRRTHESSDSRVRVKRHRAIIDHPSNRRYQLRLSGQVVRAGINSGATRILFPPRLNAPCALPCGGGGGGDPSHNSQRSCCLGRTHTKTCSYYHIHLQPHPLQGSCLPHVMMSICSSVCQFHCLTLSVSLFSCLFVVRMWQFDYVNLLVCVCVSVPLCLYVSIFLGLSLCLILCLSVGMLLCLSVLR